MNFQDHLNRQLRFLERSCQSYDAGNVDEAVRIATVIRVLVHQTGQSTSLLKHLNATTINLLTTTEDVSPNTIYSMSMGTMEIGSSGGRYFPTLGEGPINKLVPVSKWWAQVVFVFNPETKLSRRKIILSAANQDGGAHVDPALSTEYATLASEGALGYFGHTTPLGETRTPITDAHFVAIRQMAYELLNSPDLLALT